MQGKESVFKRRRLLGLEGIPAAKPGACNSDIYMWVKARLSLGLVGKL